MTPALNLLILTRLFYTVTIVCYLDSCNKETSPLLPTSKPEHLPGFVLSLLGVINESDLNWLRKKIERPLLVATFFVT